MNANLKKFLATISSSIHSAGWFSRMLYVWRVSTTIRMLSAIPYPKRETLEECMHGLRNQREVMHETYIKLAKQSLQAIVIYQEERVVFANIAAAKLLKYSVDELMALTAEQIINLAHPDDRSLVFAQLPAYLASYGTLNRTELRVIRKDGAIRWIDASLHPIQYQGHAAIVAVILDITERKWSEVERNRLFEEVRTGHERLQALSRRLLDVQEIERRHIARELHDEIGQTLTAVKLDLQTLQRADHTHDAKAHLNESIRSIENTLQQVRRLSIALRPSSLDDLGLAAALRSHVECQSRRAKLSARLLIDIGDARLPPDLETICFRIVQEAMTNIMRHAQASHVYVELRQINKHIALLISDDGIGFDVAAARTRAMHGSSLGLLGMEDRVLLRSGRIEIISALARGTTIRVQLPLPALAQPDPDWAKVSI